jgi:hypothetical protein
VRSSAPARGAALSLSLLTIGWVGSTPPVVTPAPAAPLAIPAAPAVSAGVVPIAAEPGPAAAPAQVPVTSGATAVPTAVPTPRPTSRPTAVRIKRASPPIPKPAPASTTTVEIGSWRRPVERGAQAAVDRCRSAVLYRGPWPGDGPGTSWLAGHSHCGFGFWANLKMGSSVTLRGPDRTLTYVISDRVWIPRKTGTAAGLIHHDLMLQTCVGRGTSFTYATRIPG